MHGARPSGLQKTDIQACPILLLLLLFFALELRERLYSYDYCDSCYYYPDPDSYTYYSAVEFPLVPNKGHFSVSHAQCQCFRRKCSNKARFSFSPFMQRVAEIYIAPKQYTGHDLS